MNPSEFIDFAHKLADADDSGAAGYRSAISRAYYSAFLSARGMIEDELSILCKSKDFGSHEVVQRFLMNCKVDEAMELGHWLSNLHEQRKAADYDMDETEPEDQDTAQICAAKVDEFLTQLAACSTMVMKQKIKAGIIQFKRLAGV